MRLTNAKIQLRNPRLPSLWLGPIEARSCGIFYEFPQEIEGAVHVRNRANFRPHIGRDQG